MQLWSLAIKTVSRAVMNGTGLNIPASWRRSNLEVGDRLEYLEPPEVMTVQVGPGDLIIRRKQRVTIET